ncbi:MAG: queuosine precursor transporter [Rhodoplanes sp.]
MERRIKFFLFLMTLHGSLLITSTVAGSKLFALPFGLSASATVISYMLTFVMLDAIAELYGARFSRLVINLGLVGMALSALYFKLNFKLTIALPPAGVWPYQEAFETVLGSSWRIWLAGWLAYLASQYLDLWGFLKMRDVTQGRAPLALRAFVGMLVGQFFDTTVFVTVAFYGSFPLGPALVGQYLVKVAVASLGAPLVWLAVVLGKRWVGRADASPALT